MLEDDSDEESKAQMDAANQQIEKGKWIERSEHCVLRIPPPSNPGHF
jgi:hypothetical protein